MARVADRLGLLETFLRIAERGSISAAARDLGLSQASVSRQLRDLEARLGANLIVRTTHALSLTSAGQALLSDARAALSGWAAIEERYRNDRELAGPLKIVAPLAMGQHVLADLAVGFQTRHPRISITWDMTDEQIRLAEVGFDVWIKVGPMADETLVVRRLGTVERLLVAVPAFAKSAGFARPEQLEALPLAALTPFEGGRIPLRSEKGEEDEIAPKVRFSTSNSVALKRAVLAGIGMAVLPLWFIREELASGALIDLLPDWRAPSLAVHVGFLAGERRPARVNAFLEMLAEDLPRAL